MEKAWRSAHGLRTAEEKWGEPRSSIKHRETLSNTRFLSQFKNLGNGTSKPLGRRLCVNWGGMLWRCRWGGGRAAPYPSRGFRKSRGGMAPPPRSLGDRGSQTTIHAAVRAFAEPGPAPLQSRGNRTWERGCRCTKGSLFQLIPLPRKGHSYPPVNSSH